MKIYWYNGRKNVIGERVRQLRREKGLTQKALAAQTQLCGLDIDRLAISRIESGDRFVADYEVMALVRILEVPFEAMYSSP